MKKSGITRTGYILIFIIVTLISTISKAGISVAVWGEDDLNLADVQAKILRAGTFDNVDTVNIITQGVPTLSETQKYNSILIFGGHNYWGSAVSQAIGDVLADYSDSGGGVVTTTFVLGSNLGSWILHGRFDSDRYHVMIPKTSQISGQSTLGTVYQPEHPLMEGVQVFDGGLSSYRVPSPQLTVGSTLVANWSDGTALIAFKELQGMGRRVDLNFYPSSSDVRSDFWLAGTDGDVLLANAVTWAAPEPATMLLLSLGGLFLRKIK